MVAKPRTRRRMPQLRDRLAADQRTARRRQSHGRRQRAGVIVVVSYPGRRGGRPSGPRRPLSGAGSWMEIAGWRAFWQGLVKTGELSVDGVTLTLEVGKAARGLPLQLCGLLLGAQVRRSASACAVETVSWAWLCASGCLLRLACASEPARRTTARCRRQRPGFLLRSSWSASWVRCARISAP